jgi:hypothetical protein
MVATAVAASKGIEAGGFLEQEIVGSEVSGPKWNIRLIPFSRACIQSGEGLHAPDQAAWRNAGGTSFFMAG